MSSSMYDLTSYILVLTMNDRSQASVQARVNFHAGHWRHRNAVTHGGVHR